MRNVYVDYINKIIHQKQFHIIMSTVVHVQTLQIFRRASQKWLKLVMWAYKYHAEIFFTVSLYNDEHDIKKSGLCSA